MVNKKWTVFSMLLGVLIIIGCNRSADKVSQVAGKTVGGEGSVIKQRKNTAAEILVKPQIPILCYHHIAEGRHDEYSVSPAVFAAQMRILADSGYHTVLPYQLYDYLVYNKPLPSHPVMVTFDDSRVEHAVIAAPVLEKHGFRGVFFIMTITCNKRNYMSRDQIIRLAQKGHCIGLHSWDHTMVTKYKGLDWQKQAVAPKRKLEQLIGKPVEYWAYPYGIYNHESARELNKYFKLSFILRTKRDAVYPLQTIRRMVVLDWAPATFLKSIHQVFR